MPELISESGLAMRKLFAGLTLVGPGGLVIKLRARIEGDAGFHWVVEDARMVGTDDIPESDLIDESLWRSRCVQLMDFRRYPPHMAPITGA
jgi:hypothetical protein